MVNSIKNNYLYFILSTLIAFICIFISEHQEIITSHLFADDGYWVAMPMLGHMQNVPNYQLFHDAIFWLSYWQSVPLLRLALIFVHAVSAGVLFLILRQANLAQIPAAAASVFSVTLPIFAFQHLYISASHMIAGLPALLLGILAISKLRPERGYRNWIYLVSSLFFLAIAARISPIYTLGPLAAPVGLIVIGVSKSVFKNLCGLILIVGIVAIDLYLRLIYHPHVYANAQGWSDVSVSRVFTNLRKAIKIVSRGVVDQNAIAFGIFLTGVLAIVIAIVVTLRSTRNSKSAWNKENYKVGALLIVASAITFGPASVVSVLLDRYCIVPAVLAVSSISCLMATLLNSDRPAPRWAIVSGFGLMIISNLIGARAAQQTAALGVESSHEWLTQAVSNNKIDWKPESQVVVFLPEASRSLTVGYPHFSTGYVRLLTGRDDLFALVGKRSEADALPFVEKQNLFGSGKGYWILKAGKVTRTHMVGLRPDRPLYVYAPDKNGQPRLLKRVWFFAKDGLLTAEAGGNTAAANAESNEALCDDVASGDGIVWPYSGKAELNLQKNPNEDLEFCSSGIAD